MAVGAVVVRHGRLLLVRRAHPPGRGRWSVPGGRVYRGETLVAATLRELEEETGLRGSCGPVLGWAERIGPGYHYVIVDFAVTADTGTARAGDDAGAVAWVALDEVARWPLVDGLAEFLGRHGVVPPRAP